MVCLNISQGRYGGYSHKNLNAYDLAGMDSGIDRFKTFNDLNVIGIHEYLRKLDSRIQFVSMTLKMT